MRLSNFLPILPVATAARLIVPRGGEAIESKYIVVMKNHAVSRTVTNVISKIAADADYIYSNVLNGFSATLNETELGDLLDNPYVDFVEQVTTARGSAIQEGAPWGLAHISNTLPGQNHRTYTYDDSAGKGTCAYVIDSGIEVEHPEFEGRAKFVQNFVDNADLDANGHGTHVAGTIGSKTYGVAKKTKLFAVKVLNENTEGQTSGIIAGMDFVAEDAATRKCPKGIVVNMSISLASSPAVNAAARFITKSGLFLAVAAGNDDSDAFQVSPANEPSACTVGATVKNDTRALFSNYGVVIDVFAPGVEIKSTWVHGGFKVKSGTSMATPHVTGLAAYLMGLSKVKASTLCNRIASSALKGIIKGVPENTVNLLIQNDKA
ncbi:hypothetical protein ACHAPA_011520 [Fusarium lateritium]